MKQVAPHVFLHVLPSDSDLPACDYTHGYLGTPHPIQLAAVSIVWGEGVNRNLCLRCLCMITSEHIKRDVIIYDS